MYIDLLKSTQLKCPFYRKTRRIMEYFITINPNTYVYLLRCPDCLTIFKANWEDMIDERKDTQMSKDES